MRRNQFARWFNRTPPSVTSSLAFCVASPAGSLVGLLIVANKQVACSIDLSHAFTFASGALLTVSLLSLVPEATEVRRKAFLYNQSCLIELTRS